jgi:5-methylcytosine-specific restriction endonuclease McrA
MNDTLVLDNRGEPVGFVTWQRAVTLYWNDRAEIVREDAAGAVLRSPSFEMGMPRVIRVKNSMAKRLRHRLVCSRATLAIRDNSSCQYCGQLLSTYQYTLDHVIPRSQGGTSCWENLVIACVKCNKRKGGRTPKQAGMTLMSTPVEPSRWDKKYNFRLRIKKLRPEWEDYKNWLSAESASYLYWNAELQP